MHPSISATELDKHDYVCTSFIFLIQNLFYFQTQFFLKKIFTFFLQIYEIPYLSYQSLSSKRDHEEMEQGDDEVMEGTDKKIKT